MTLTELHREMRAAMDGPIEPAHVDLLTKEAERFASTVSWAEGVIDKDGRIHEAFDALREMAKVKYQQKQDPNIATLHDTIGDLILAIRNHDEDIDPSDDNEDHDD